MRFSTQDGTFTASFILDKAVTQPSEIFVHKAVWYPMGFKTTVTVDGKAIDDVKLVTSADSNYVQILFGSDALANNSGKEVKVLLSPPLPAVHTIPGEDYETTVAVMDLGNSAKCEFEAIFDPSTPQNVVYHVLDKDDVRMAEISEKTPKAVLPCYDIAEGSLLLVELPEGFLDVTDVLMTQPLSGLNGTKVSLSLRANATVQI